MSTTELTSANSSCQRFDVNIQTEWTENKYLFSTDAYWEISKMRCVDYGTLWLRAFLEYDCFSQSGRHYRTSVSESQLKDITANDAISIIEATEFRIVRGSYFNDQLFVSQGPAPLNRNP